MGETAFSSQIRPREGQPELSGPLGPFHQGVCLLLGLQTPEGRLYPPWEGPCCLSSSHPLVNSQKFEGPLRDSRQIQDGSS